MQIKNAHLRISKIKRLQIFTQKSGFPYDSNSACKCTVKNLKCSQ